MVREGLRSVLSAHPEVEVVGEASDGAEAVGLTGRLRPDIVLVDVNTPRLNGIEAIREIRKTVAGGPARYALRRGRRRDG